MRRQNSIRARISNTKQSEGHCFKVPELSLFCHVPIHFTVLCILMQMSRAALQRYLFYCNRYMNHMQSLKFENKVSFAFLSETLQQHV